MRDSGDIALVDVGWSAETCAEPARAIGRLHAAVLRVRTRASDAIVEQLAALGIERSRVRTVVATHLHLDHVGGLVDFPDAEVVLTRREHDAFRAKLGTGYRAKDLERTGRLREVELDAGPTYGFPASADVFGDGEVLLLDARGHTAGGVAVVLRAPATTYVHAGDAVYEKWEYSLGRRRGPSLVARFTAWNRPEMVKTYACLRACEGDARRPVVVPSHDAAAFDGVPHVPAHP